MCIMCLEFARDRMSIFEVRRALTELVATADNDEDLAHYKDLEQMSDEEIKEQAKKQLQD